MNPFTFSNNEDFSKKSSNTYQTDEYDSDDLLGDGKLIPRKTKSEIQWIKVKPDINGKYDYHKHFNNILTEN